LGNARHIPRLIHLLGKEREMKKYIYPRLVFLLCFLFVIQGIQAQEFKTTPAKSNHGAPRFLKNQGQILNQNFEPNSEVLYLLNGAGINVQVRRDQIAYDVYRQVKSDTGINFLIERVEIELLGSNPFLEIEEYGEQVFRSNYCIAGQNGSSFNMRSYNRLLIKNVYSGVDLELLANGRFKYNFIVQPGAKTDQIQLRYKGDFKSQLEDRGLVIELSESELIEAIPKCFQLDSKDTLLVEGKYQKTEHENIYQIQLSKYDLNRTLIIDPRPTISWSSYIGGNGLDIAKGIQVDSYGNYYVAGQTSTSTFGGNQGIMATTGAYQSVIGGSFDVFINKFSPSGQRIWGTYFGGSSVESLADIFVLANGDFLITGATQSASVGINANIIASQGAHQPDLLGVQDGFISKFDSTGSRVWSTYYGGTGTDEGKGISYDPSSGYIAVVGHSRSTNTGSDTLRVASGNAYQNYHAGSQYIPDAFVALFDGAGNRQWGTFYGGTGFDFAASVCFNQHSEILFTGSTSTNHLFANAGVMYTSGAHQEVHKGSYDAYIASFDTSGSRVWSTYVGGSETENPQDIEIDSKNNILLVGGTNSGGSLGNDPETISTPGAHQENFGGGFMPDAFCIKFTEDGQRIWGTFYGSADYDYAYSVSIDELDNIILAGQSAQGPPQDSLKIATNNAWQKREAGSRDGFIVKLDSTGSRQFGTFYGGDESDFIYGIASDKRGNIIAVGQTNSGESANPGVFNHNGVHQNFHGGLQDAFIAKFTDVVGANNAAVESLVSPYRICKGSNAVEVEIVNRGINVLDSVEVHWELDGQIQNTIFLSTPIAPGESFSLSLGNILFPADSLRQFTVYTSNPNGTQDTIPENDTFKFRLRPSLEGTYTIGSINADYTDFYALSEDLNQYGLCGPVDVIVQSGNYNQPLVLESVHNLNRQNPLRILGAGKNSVIWQYQANDTSQIPISLTDISYVSVSGFTLETNKGAVLAQNGSHHVDLHDLVVYDTSNLTGIAIDLNDGEFITLKNCEVYGGNTGVNMNGGTKRAALNLIESCLFSGQIQNSIQASNQDFLTITKSDLWGSDALIGVNLSNVSNMEVSNNRIRSGTGLSLFSVNSQGKVPDAVFKSQVYNNAIFSAGTGIHASDINEVHFLHNAIQFDSNATGSAGFSLSNFDKSSRMLNNIIKVTSGSTGTPVRLDQSILLNIDYNLYDTDSLLLERAGNKYSQLSDIISDLGIDSNSIVNNAHFRSAKDFRVSIYYSGIASGVELDIEEQERCPSTPAIGIDEPEWLIMNTGTIQILQSPIQNVRELIAMNSGGNAFDKSWLYQDSIIASGDTINFTFSDSGAITLQLVSTNCIASDTQSITIQVLPNLPIFQLVGAARDTSEVNMSYQDPGFIAKNALGQSIQSLVSVMNSVDETTLGTYFIRYYLNDGFGNLDTLVRTVVIEDYTPPTISLIGSNNLVVDVFGNIGDPGAQISDNYYSQAQLTLTIDSSSVNKSILGIYPIHYRLEDPSGNVSNALRFAVVVDRVAPVIQLRGSDSLSIPRWITYQDQGVIIQDNYYDTSSLNRHLISFNTVNVNWPGRYEVCYEVVDPSGNRSDQVCREVFVLSTNPNSTASKPSENRVTLYPNPTNGIVWCEHDLGSGSVRIEIRDLAGRMMDQAEFRDIEKFQLDLSNLSPGMYIIQFQTQNYSSTHKVKVFR